MILKTNAPGFTTAVLQNAEVAVWFDTGPVPKNEPEKGIYYLQAAFGLVERLTICIRPINVAAFADRLIEDYKQQNPAA